jgi:predicted glutamine amidotransferase
MSGRRSGRPVGTGEEGEDDMCRWLAYSGTPVKLEEMLYKPAHSLIDQSLHSRLGVDTTNGDGFGVGWYGEGLVPAVFKSVEPAWNDRNLREIAAHVRSGLVFAHVRASTGTPVQQTNCHPFRHGNWLWMHNGSIERFHDVKRELVLAVDPSLYPDIEGSTDSEAFFFLALTLGLEDDPPAAVERAVGLIEHVGRGQGIEHPIQMTLATTDGSSIWVFRYSSQGTSRSLFYSTEVATLRAQYPDNPILRAVSDETRLIVSEPLGDLAGAWNEVPESSYGVVQAGEDELRPFTPRPPG